MSAVGRSEAIGSPISAAASGRQIRGASKRTLAADAIGQNLSYANVGYLVSQLVSQRERHVPTTTLSMLGNLLISPVGDTLTQCDPFGIPSTSHWTGAAITVK
jgi:hypothetical protein